MVTEAAKIEKEGRKEGRKKNIEVPQKMSRTCSCKA